MAARRASQPPGPNLGPRVYRPFDQERKLARSGLAELFSGVEILSDKTVASYRSVISRRGIEPEEFVMVGNSLRSDILPVVQMGGRAVHIPYHLTWSHEHVDEDSLPSDGWHRLERIGELGPLLASLDAPARRPDRHELQSRPDRKSKRDSGPLSSG